MKTGKFITFEGIDGAGKSTHLAWLESFLRGKGIEVVVTREPGGTPLGENIRALLLDGRDSMHPETEALLMFASRREHVERVILPALERGQWVISDRFTDASYAYQGGGRGLSTDRLDDLEKWTLQDFQPDLTIYFDVSVEIGRQRVSTIKTADRFEREKDEFFSRVRSSYLDRVRRFPQRIRLIDSNQPLEKVKESLNNIISTFC